MAMISLIVNCLCRLQLAFGVSDFAAAFGVSPLLFYLKMGWLAALLAARSTHCDERGARPRSEGVEVV